MGRDPSASTGTRVGRAIRRRCPRCGEEAFDGYFSMKESCPGCGLHFEREPGYWVGAMIINTTFIFATFLITFGAGMAITWPNVPWVGLLVALVVVNVALPVLFYPSSKTLWSALEMGWHPLEPGEIEDARRRVDG